MAVDTVITIEPTSGIPSLGVRETWARRDLLWYLTSRQVKGSYRQMALGPLWILLQPIMSMIIMSFVFGKVAKLPSDGVPYPLFTYAAILPWTLFAGSLRSVSQCILSEKNIISKVYIPRLIIPLSSMSPNFVNFAASAVVLVILMAVYFVVPAGDTLQPLSWRVFTLPLFLVLALLTALGTGLYLSGLSVRYRDVVIGLGFFIQAWQYLTPVAYSASLVPESAQWLYRLNPMTTVVLGFRWALFGLGTFPASLLVGQMLLMTVVTLVGLVVYSRSLRTIVDLF